MASKSVNDLAVTHYCILFLPFASLTMCGDIVIFKVFGMPLYRRVGSVHKFMFSKRVCSKDE